MSAIESRASEQHQRVPDALRLAFLLVFKPRELRERMVLWNLDGDLGLAFIGPLSGRNKRDWVSGLAQILGAVAFFAYFVLLIEYKWSVLLGLLTKGLLVTVLVACVAGIAFATLLGVLAAVTMMVGVWLPPEIAGVPAMAALWCFGIGFAVRISWTLHSGQHSFRPFVLAGGAVACYWFGETGLQRIALTGLLGLGISLHPLVDWIHRVVQRRRRPHAGGTEAVRVIPNEDVMRDQVFISYSHHDKRYMEELLTHLKPHMRSGIKAWSDKEIAPGSQWFDKIQEGLSKTSVAVLLVSPEFLASDFIHEHELGPLLKKAKMGGVRILWIPIRASGYEATPLQYYQAVSPREKPLAEMGKAVRARAWVQICKEIERVFA